MSKEVKKKNILQDVIPPKRSIRNVELTSRATRFFQENKQEGKTKKTESVFKDLPKHSEGNKSYKAGAKAADATTTPVTTPEIAVADFTRPLSGRLDVEQTFQSKPQTPNNPPPGSMPLYTYEYEEPRKSKRVLLYFSIVILVFVGAFSVSSVFKSADIKVTPKQETISLDKMFTAKKNAVTGELPFQLVTITKDVEKTVSGTGQKQVNTKAQGTIVVYNNYSATTQKLLANTRFQTSEGLIFRLVSPATIPGMNSMHSSSIAGSVEVKVVADVTGDTYNIGLKDFTIPGFKGTPKYASIYARSKTEMTGGFSGIQKIVSQNVINLTDKELEASLKDLLSKDIASQIPANFVLYPNSISYNFNPIAQISSSLSGAVLDKKGTMNAIIFDKGFLSKNIFAKVEPELINDVANITNLENLDFLYATGTSFDPSTSTGVTFNLKGNIDIVWIFDLNKLKSDLLGLSKKNAEAVIATYKGIKEAWVTTRPFWSQTIPTNPDKVTIVNTLVQP